MARCVFATVSISQFKRTHDFNPKITVEVFIAGFTYNATTPNTENKKKINKRTNWWKLIERKTDEYLDGCPSSAPPNRWPQTSNRFLTASQFNHFWMFLSLYFLALYFVMFFFLFFFFILLFSSKTDHRQVRCTTKFETMYIFFNLIERQRSIYKTLAGKVIYPSRAGDPMLAIFSN